MTTLTIVQLLPYAWEDDTEAGNHVRALSAELAGRGHRLLIAAPSRDDRAVRAARRKVAGDAALGAAGEVTLLPLGEAFGVGGRATIPIDVSRTAEALLSRPDVDLCHLHDPWAPSLASVALRESRVLNVGTFHAPTERLLAAQAARRPAARVLGRLDLRLTTTAATAALIGRHFPGDYTIVAPPTRPQIGGEHEDSPHIVFVDDVERQALRLVLRALRRLPEEVPWRATIASDAPAPALRASLRTRIGIVPVANAADALQSASVVVLPALGHAPRPAPVALAAGSPVIPVISDLPAFQELACGRGLAFPPGDADTLGDQLRRLVTETALRERLAASPPAPARSWADVADEIEAGYQRLLAHRHDTHGDPRLWRRLSGRPLIDVDLHMHTDHSGDCATPVEHLLATAREQGLGAIAITDHNEISGALEAAEKSARYGVKVIVGEEVKTANQGEVIGLFLSERIERGLTLAETVAEIKRQGGLVYVPHPFDRMHAVPDYEHLLPIIDQIDAIEIYNPRVAIGAFNEEAERFAAKYRIVRGAGSDSHVAAGLGSVRIRMRDFDGPQEFLESLRHAEIHTKSGTLLYVQALKFLETKATPAGARRARRERRVRRAQRQS